MRGKSDEKVCNAVSVVYYHLQQWWWRWEGASRGFSPAPRRGDNCGGVTVGRRLALVLVLIRLALALALVLVHRRGRTQLAVCVFLRRGWGRMGWREGWGKIKVRAG